MRVDREDIEEKSCLKRFRIGENVYTSTRKITIPIMIKTLRGNNFKREVTANVIHKEEELFLSGVKTLVDWKAAVFF